MSTTTAIVRRRAARRAKRRPYLRLLTIVGLVLAIIISASLVGTVILAVGVYSYFARDLPDPEALRAMILEAEFETTVLYDSTGQNVLYEVIDPLGGDRQWVPLSDLPPYVIHATIAIEDQTFYENPGYDLWGILRALWSNIRGYGIQGGSTITQQLIKNTLISPELRSAPRLERTIAEIILAAEISRRYTKDEILEWYLNTNFYGNLAYGIEAAARVYFGKHASELTLAEAAMLAAIPQSPTLNPLDNPDEARVRQAAVLRAMVEQGYITQEEADRAMTEPIIVRPVTQRYNIRAPHFSIYARHEAEAILNSLGYEGERLVSRGGLRIYTTLDLDLQYQAECVARTHLLRLSGEDPTIIVPASNGEPCHAAAYLPPLAPEDVGIDHNANNVAVVVLNARTGEILAMVGSRDYWDEEIDGNFNAALGLRQPGSAFKPLVYVTAFAQGYTPATMTLDVRTPFSLGGGPPYVPENFDGRYHGVGTIRWALGNSYNVPAVQVLSWVGIDETLRTAHRMGINSLNMDPSQYGLSLALGSGEVSLIDLTYAYSVFANMGVMAGRPIPPGERRAGYRLLDPVSIKRIEVDDPNGGPPIILWQLDENEGTFAQDMVLNPSLAYLMNDVLSDREARWEAMGRGNALELSRPAAAKTGTTNDFRDSWTIGYTPQIVTGVWVGNTDGSPMVNVSGLVGAAPIWHAVMEYAHRDLPVEEWPRPDDIVERWVCEVSGLLPNEYCPQYLEIFISGTEPTEYDRMWQMFQINRETGRLATVCTPPELLEERVYVVYPPEAADWVRETGQPQPPTESDPIDCQMETRGPVAITEPEPFSYVHGQVEVRGNAGGSGFSYYRLSYGAGLNPTEWFQIGQDRYRPVEDDLLGVWDTSTLDGLYTLRLSVVRTGGRVENFYLLLTVDNQSPVVALLHPTDGQVFVPPRDEVVILDVQVADNISMDRVEYYMDGELVAVSAVPPYSARWVISAYGEHTFWAVAYDAAGNQVSSNRATVEVRREE